MKTNESFCSTKVIESEDYIPRVCAYTYEKATKVYTEAFEKAFEFIVLNRIQGDIAEFGTLEGFTASVLAKFMKENNYLVDIHLFDSFEGLPKISNEIDRNSYEVNSYNVWKEGSMAVGVDIPVLIRNRLQNFLPNNKIHIHKGFFKDTFQPKILKNKLSLVNIDCDLYQSSKEVLSKLFEYDLVQDGMILLFDDFNCGRANPNFGERRALKEVMEDNKNYSYSLFYYYGWHGAAIILHDLSYGQLPPPKGEGLK